VLPSKLIFNNLGSSLCYTVIVTCRYKPTALMKGNFTLLTQSFVVLLQVLIFIALGNMLDTLTYMYRIK